MENASKALIMAASVLLGVMIISVAVALFNSFSDFSRSNVEKMDEKKLAEWNNNFLKYYGSNLVDVTKQINGKNVIVGEKEETIRVTAHDIISVANLAKQNNANYQFEEPKKYDENTYYVQVCVRNYGTNNKIIENFECKDEKYKTDFLNENSLVWGTDEDGKETYLTKYYKCTRVEISKVTKRVMYIEFAEYK